jgi:hypothetical protein
VVKAPTRACELALLFDLGGDLGLGMPSTILWLEVVARLDERLAPSL